MLIELRIDGDRVLLEPIYSYIYCFRNKRNIRNFHFGSYRIINIGFFFEIRILTDLRKAVVGVITCFGNFYSTERFCPFFYHSKPELRYDANRVEFS